MDLFSIKNERLQYLFNFELDNVNKAFLDFKKTAGSPFEFTCELLIAFWLAVERENLDAVKVIMDLASEAGSTKAKREATDAAEESEQEVDIIRGVIQHLRNNGKVKLQQMKKRQEERDKIAKLQQNDEESNSASNADLSAAREESYWLEKQLKIEQSNVGRFTDEEYKADFERRY